ncbi:hypothetical protein BN8_02458 [Fibrisoma limi BUZ 3]|uniref:Uncharacterized protein n=1 Tax=Fibrisoma limi BUZ 3 TaxID=1185876 RepID=I2GHJ1_9BACT|nr:YihY/virulence factor BrkB family protein [Fibrisoma limi]CCH53366.1 hypothetical protein BN8_02458 [Fibrisoma limi BUZ 3]
MRRIPPFLHVAANAFTNLKANDPIRMAAATAFFAFFALPAIVIILTQLYGELLTGDERWVRWQLFRKLAEVFGRPSARQLRDISRSLQQSRSSGLSTLVSVFVLLLASTTMFMIIKNSINQLWNVRATPQRRVWNALADRLIALGVIVLTGFLFTASLALQRVLATVIDPGSTAATWLSTIQDHGLSVLILTIWFGVVFKYLPDVRIDWRAVWVGALVTGVLVEIGEFVLARLLINSAVGSLYGSAGAITLVLLFVFYCSLIFYYGASFTRQYAQWKRLDARPKPHSVTYQIREVDE